MCVYVSLDVETTGLDTDKCDIIEFGAVVDDLVTRPPLRELPKFHSYVYRDFYTGQAQALAMHADKFKAIAELKNVRTPDDLLLDFHHFLTEHKVSYPVTLAGKNVASFDRLFLNKLKNEFVTFRHRAIDPAILYFDPRTDPHLPSLAACLQRAGIVDPVTHNALDDALLVVKLLRHKYT